MRAREDGESRCQDNFTAYLRVYVERLSRKTAWHANVVLYEAEKKAWERVGAVHLVLLFSPTTDVI